MKKYIHATEELGKQFFIDFQDSGEIHMLNLLKFKKEADYSSFPEIAPEQPISGEEAYALYMVKAMPFLSEIGSTVIFQGKANHFLIGPEYESWDFVLLVKHPSIEKFMSFARNENYLKIANHRSAAVEDSRLLPISI